MLLLAFLPNSLGVSRVFSIAALTTLQEASISSHPAKRDGPLDSPLRFLAASRRTQRIAKSLGDRTETKLSTGTL